MRPASPVVLAFTAEKPNADIGPFDAAAALDKLNVAEPRPVPVDRPAVYARVAAALEALPGASVAVLADGLAAPMATKPPFRRCSAEIRPTCSGPFPTGSTWSG